MEHQELNNKSRTKTEEALLSVSQVSNNNKIDELI